jgi:hypothetical protein
MHTAFAIRILNTFWIVEPENELDHCAHGYIEVVIGDEMVVDGTTDWTISSTALYLLRTLEREHNIDPHKLGDTLVPCCGFCFWIDAATEEVYMPNCPNGFDWEVRHERDLVHLKTENGTMATMTFADYKTEVLAFVDKVEAFYNESPPKKEHDDEMDRVGYLEFWREWRQRRARWT